MTLVECLAVVALLALAASMIAVGISPSAVRARLREGRSLVLDADARGRELARLGDRTTLAIKGGVVIVRAGGGDRPAIQRALPGALEVVLRDASSRLPLAGTLIDARGRSADYVISLRAGGRRSDTLVAGLTGYAFNPEEFP